MSYILYTYTTESRKNYAKALQKCFSKYSFKNYFVYHSPDNTASLVEPSLIFNEKEIYENISLKTYHCLNHFLNTDFEFFIKMNDDCAVDIEKLNKHFKTFANYDVVGWFVRNNYKEFDNKEMFKAKHIHYFKLQKNENLMQKQVFDIPYPEGSFYVLSRNAVENILSRFKKEDFLQHLDRFIGEDMTMGIFINSFPGFKIYDIRHNVGLHMNITLDYISTHPIRHIFIEKFLSLNDKDKLNFLTSIQFSNEYILKDKFLNELYEKHISVSTTL